MARIGLSDREDLPLNIFRALINSQPVARGFASLGGKLLAELELDAKIRELVINSISLKLDAPYEWSHHAKPALDLGVTAEQLQGLKDNDLSSLEPVERACVEFARKVDDRTVTDADTEQLKQLGLDDRKIVELTVLTGFYGLVARFLVAMNVELDPHAVHDFGIPEDGEGAAEQLTEMVRSRSRRDGAEQLPPQGEQG